MQAALKFLERFQKFSGEPGLHRMEKMLELLGRPEKSLVYVHVTGTNGKGSTSATVASIVKSAGYKVGLFTSPHLHRYNERIKVNGRDISDEDFIHYVEKLKTLLKKNPSIQPMVFEVLTVMAFLYFADQKVDLAVLEVGIGGRYDATNVIEKSVSVITNVDLEHTAVLGKTKAKIAFQKAGIIKPKSTVVVGERDRKLQAVFSEVAKRNGAKIIYLKPREVKSLATDIKGQSFDFKNLKKLFTPLVGEHQLNNVPLAVLASRALNEQGFKITDENIRDGLRKTIWPLRMELVCKNPSILLDAGHNPHGVKAIVKAVDAIFPKEDRILVLGCSYDKPYKEMSKILSKLSDTIIVTRAKSHGVDPKEMVKVLSRKKKIFMTKNVKEALNLAQRMATKKTLILVLGGLYLAAEAKEVLTPRAVQRSR